MSGERHRSSPNLPSQPQPVSIASHRNASHTSLSQRNTDFHFLTLRLFRSSLSSPLCSAAKNPHRRELHTSISCSTLNMAAIINRPLSPQYRPLLIAGATILITIKYSRGSRVTSQKHLTVGPGKLGDGLISAVCQTSAVPLLASELKTPSQRRHLPCRRRNDPHDTINPSINTKSYSI